MKLTELIEKLNLKILTQGVNLEKKVEGGYAGDLLSWVMAHAKENQVWITIQSHQNIVAVASLLGLCAIIVAEGVEVEENTLKKAEEENIPILSSEKSTFELCGILYNLLNGSKIPC
ncbi:MAG: DRTGG domain-containing protein [Thermovenabulum sp.]|uniref:DRTGG domain-containing protein n=1 Tax=Thermovenabulum sp. TaxID=3100335 RepID=UPI003C7C1188